MLLAKEAIISIGVPVDIELKSLSRRSSDRPLLHRAPQIFNESQVFHYLDELEEDSHQQQHASNRTVIGHIDRIAPANRQNDATSINIATEFDEVNVKVPCEADLQEWFDDAEFHVSHGDEEEAELILQDCFDWREKILGPLHPDTIRTLANLVDLLIEEERFDDAYDVHIKLLQESERLVGREHPTTLRIMHAIGDTLHLQGNLSSSAELYSRALLAKERTLGAQHASTVWTAFNLAIVKKDQGYDEEAEDLLRKCAHGYMLSVGPGHHGTLKAKNNLACLLLRNNRNIAECEELFREVIKHKMQLLGVEHPSTRASINNYANLRMRRGRKEEGKKLMQKANKDTTCVVS